MSLEKKMLEDVVAVAVADSGTSVGSRGYNNCKDRVVVVLADTGTTEEERRWLVVAVP